jgi:hypothetical protein
MRGTQAAMSGCMRLLLLGALVAGCSMGFDIPVDVPELVIPGDPSAHASGQHYEASTSQPFALAISLDDEQGNANMVSSVYLTSLSFSITQASGCFDFIDELSLSIVSTKADTKLPAAVIATAKNPGCVTTLEVIPTPGLDLDPYFKEGAGLTATGSGVPPATNVSFNGHVTLHASL